MLSLVSCAKDDALTERVQVTFETSFLKAESRTMGQDDEFTSGQYVDSLYCAVYEKVGDGYVYIMKGAVGKNSNGKFSYSPMLVKDKTYKVVFWAMHPKAYTINDPLTEIKIPANTACNNPKMDAFTGQSEDITVGASQSIKNVVLKRPFALLNFATKKSDLDEAKTKYSVTEISDIKASVTVSMNRIATAYNAVKGVVTYSDGPASYEFTASSILGTEEEYQSKVYNRIASCYVWPVGNATCIIELKKNDDTAINSVNVKNVPLTLNYITNIYGELLMGASEYNVTVHDVQTVVGTEETEN